MEKIEQEIPKEKTCKNCGKQFLPHQRNEQYCSDECRRLGRNAVNRARYHRNNELSRIYSEYEQKKQRGVQDADGVEHRRGKGLYTQPRELLCVYCGKPFTATHVNVKYCSPSCKKAAAVVAGNRK